MRREFDLQFAIRGRSGRLYDLPEGLLLAVRAACDAMPSLESFVELGAGTGAAAALVLRRAPAKRVLVHDESEVAARHLREHLGTLAIEMGARLEVVSGDCRTQPFTEPISLLALALPYAQQPSLLVRRGRELREALGDDGLLVAATSTVGMRFYQSLIDGDDRRLAAWPWYKPGHTLRDLFGAGATVRVRNLVLSIASGSSYRVDATVAGMVARGGELLG
jgi:hypothetical protein